ncbi:MAG: signal transduction histidine kinase [Bacteroidetes bacterium]|nr:MAG: signal transduction histidine kinase [Bacteroidota bacterium]
MNILIVDDNPRNIQIVGNILVEQNYNIAYSTDGKRALELANNNDFDLILLDIMMPEMDGFEVCKHLRNNATTIDVPVIFLTAKTDEDSILKGFKAGANDYVTKPFNSSELLARVITQLELHSKRKQLDSLNRNLEIIVKDRTAQLEIANEQLGRIEKSKSDFLSIIGHELRTPLNALVGLNSIMQTTTLTEEQQEYLVSMEQTSNRLARFSEMALLITSLQARSQQPEMFPMKVNILFEMALDELQYRITEKNIKLFVSPVSDSMLVIGDSELIRNCLVILIENAINNLPDGGIIELYSFENDKKEICLQVSDNGPGFTNEILDFFTNEFDPVTMSDRASSGLSLTAVRLIMEAHGGRISINNKPEGGAKVYLLFKQPA